ncbi:MAG: DUF72 domain-containing protein [Candidatus Bathyarchaeia archaeon]
MELLVGAGGWLYFQVPGLKPLVAYSRAFNFVEVNSTFYKIPDLEVAELWRKMVSDDFVFSVRCHRDVTHKYMLRPVEEALDALERMVEVCEVLNARYLVLQTPATLGFDAEEIGSARNLLESVNLKRARLVWEIRKKPGKPVPKCVTALMQDLDIIHCMDISKEAPLVQSDTVYTRVFGKGQRNIYQFSDEELAEIDSKIMSVNPRVAAVSFHNVRMYKDAARFRIYKETGKFPSVTGVEGKQSLRKVLMEDARFPATREELLKTQGWKVIDLVGDKRVHASALLVRLPSETFRSVEEVLAKLSLTSFY